MSVEEQTAEEFLKDKSKAEAEIEKITQSNFDRLKSFAQQGINFGPDALTLLKLEALIDTIMTDENARLILAYNIELKKKEFFDNVMSEIRQAQIMQGVQEQASKLVIPKR